MKKQTTEQLYRRFVEAGEVAALAEVFDRVAPDLERLARRLTKDTVHAEDLVQETFLTALERPETFDPERPLRPWLLGILAHRARDRRGPTGTLAEAQHVSAGATPEAGALESETRAAVDAAIEELPTSMRSVVRGKLLEGRETSELARELSISTGALRVRLSRGLERLRRLLPASLASGFALVCLHSRGMARVRGHVLQRGSRLAGSGTIVGTSGFVGFLLLVPKSMLVLMGVGSVLGGAWTLARALAAPDEKPSAELVLASASPDTTNEIPRVAPGATRTAVTARPSARSADASAPARVGGTLRGRVVDEAGQPVAGAEVVAWNHSRRTDGPDLRVQADAGGRFVLEQLGPAFCAEAYRGELVCQQGLRGDLSPGMEAVDLELVVAHGATLRGVVRDATRRSVADAKLEVRAPLSHSQASMTHAAGIETYRAGWSNATTDAAGRFELSGLPPGRSHVSATCEPFLVYGDYHEPGPALLEITLDPGLRLGGRVFAASGAPAQGAEVGFGPYIGNRNTAPEVVTTDEHGTFTFVGIGHPDEEPTWITVLHAGHALQVVQPVQADELGGEFVEVLLEREQLVEGRVVDAAGRGLSGIALWIEGEREVDYATSRSRRNTWEEMADISDTRTDEFGRFRFAQLNPGSFRVHAVSAADRRMDVQVDTQAGERDLVIELSAETLAKVVVRGVVRDAITGEALDDLEVCAWSPRQPAPGGAGGWEGWTYEFPHANGRFEIGGLEANTYRFQFRHPGYSTKAITLGELDVGVHELEVVLSPARTLVVAVVDSDGTPIDNGTLQVFDRAGEPRMIPVASGSKMLSLDLRGEPLPLHDLPAELVTLRIEAGDRELDVPIDLTQPFEGTFEIVVDADPLGRLDIRILGASAELDADEIQRRIADEDHAWMWQRFEQEELFQPRVAIEAEVVDATGRVLATASVTPIDGTRLVGNREYPLYRLEISRASGRNGWSASVEQTDPSFSLTLRARAATLRIRLAGRDPILFELTRERILRTAEPFLVILRP